MTDHTPPSSEKMVRIMFWQLIASVGLVGALLASFSITKSSLHANTQNVMLDKVISLDKVFVDKPELYKYFYQGKNASTDSKDYEEAVAAAQMTADVLDMVSDGMDQLEDPEAWDAWIVDMLRTGPILRTYIDQHPCWYGDALKKRLKRARPEANVASCPKATSR